jgi:hypothetical protein
MKRAEARLMVASGLAPNRLACVPITQTTMAFLRKLSLKADSNWVA